MIERQSDPLFVSIASRVPETGPSARQGQYIVVFCQRTTALAYDIDRLLAGILTRIVKNSTDHQARRAHRLAEAERHWPPVRQMATREERHSVRIGPTHCKKPKWALAAIDGSVHLSLTSNATANGKTDR